MFLPALAFMLGLLFVTAAAAAVMSRPSAAIDRRLRDVIASHDTPPPVDRQEVAAFFRRMGERMPMSPSEQSKLQQRLAQAGYRRPDALMIFLGLRLAVALGVFV